MRFQVPQFIEVEDKLFGSLSFKQFAYVAGAAGLAFVIYKFTPIFIWIILVPLVIVFGLALAFYKVNNKPFIDFLESAFMYYTKDNLYIWRKEEKKLVPIEQKKEEPRQVFVPRLSESKLKELSWSLDINENLNPLTGDNGKTTR